MSAIDSGFVRYGMTRFHDFDSLERQSITVLHDNDAAANSVAKKILDGERHLCRGFAAPNDKNISNVRKAIASIGYLEVIIMKTNIRLDPVRRVSRFHAGHEYFPRMGAQPDQRCHIADSNNRKRAISNGDGPGGNCFRRRH